MTEDARLIPLDLERITITYKGLDADGGSLDMALMAKSLDGYARILTTVTSFAVSSVYHKHIDAMPVRARVTDVKEGSFCLFAAMDYIVQSQLIPNLPETVVALLKWMMARLAGRPEADGLKDVALKQLDVIDKENGRVAKVMEKMADALAAAARNAVSPVGGTCKTTGLALGQEAITVWDESDKVAINDRVKPSIQPTQEYTVYVPELDMVSGTAKVSFSDSDPFRCKARITDPCVFEPESAYALALAHQTALIVTAKAEILDGEIVQLYVSDSARVPSNAL